MGIQHLSYNPVEQGSETTGCWAASMSWWLGAVRKVKYSMTEIADMYWQYTNEPVGAATIGGLKDAGVIRLFSDTKWRIWQAWISRQEFKDGDVDSYLADSPTFISYYSPELKGAHMNVVVAKATSNGAYYIMDPSYKYFQVRKLNYYTERSKVVVLASSKPY